MTTEAAKKRFPSTEALHQISRICNFLPRASAYLFSIVIDGKIPEARAAQPEPQNKNLVNRPAIIIFPLLTLDIVSEIKAPSP